MHAHHMVYSELIALRMRRYVTPKANGELKCSKETLDLYKTEDGRS